PIAAAYLRIFVAAHGLCAPSTACLPDNLFLCFPLAVIIWWPSAPGFSSAKRTFWSTAVSSLLELHPAVSSAE
ncbi:hypothetical protein, partial [Salmonella enterica]|uniref:hypothetical protein n=1 Tax=Salmonella enterica TaxID=28901 RepID=UPI00352E3E17